MMGRHLALFGESHLLEANKALVPYAAGGNDSQQQKAGAHGLADTQGMEGEAEQKGRARSQEPGRDSRRMSGHVPSTQGSWDMALETLPAQL
jgi:hypothetical protein